VDQPVETGHSTSAARPIDILLVEPDESDVRLTVEALRTGKISNPVSVVRDAAEALAFLRREGRFATVQRPDLILLDLDLGPENGRRMLAEINAEPDLSMIPVVILTVAYAEHHLLRAEQPGARAYLRKPVDLLSFIRTVESFEQFSLTIASFPDGACILGDSH
jgi:CheY-like chemotaxis protein